MKTCWRFKSYTDIFLLGNFIFTKLSLKHALSRLDSSLLFVDTDL